MVYLESMQETQPVSLVLWKMSKMTYCVLCFNNKENAISWSKKIIKIFHTYSTVNCYAYVNFTENFRKVFLSPFMKPVRYFSN